MANVQYSPYKSNVTNRELVFLGTDPQPKLGSATFSAAYLHCRGKTDLSQERGCFPAFEQPAVEEAVLMPLLQNQKISLYEGVTGNLLVQVPTAF